jgi:hypothetical protein
MKIGAIDGMSYAFPNNGNGLALFLDFGYGYKTTTDTIMQ